MLEERSEINIPAYKHESDDPYKILAYNIMVEYPTPIVKRFLRDNKFIRRTVIREVRGQDFSGYFLDCLFVSIFEGKKRMDLMRQLNQLGIFLYRNLDLQRLRKEIRGAYEEMGMADLLE